MVVTQLGLGELVLLFVGFGGLIAYFTALPLLGPFDKSDNPRSSAVTFYNYLNYLVLLLGIWVSLSSGWLFVTWLSFYFLVAIPMYFNARSIGAPIKYQELAAFKSSKISLRPSDVIVRRFFWLGLLVFAILAELLSLDYLNSSLPLIIWIFLLFLIVSAIITVAIGTGFVHLFTSSLHVRVETSDGKELVGFLSGKGEDYYVLLGKDRQLLLQSSYVHTMEVVPFAKA